MPFHIAHRLQRVTSILLGLTMIAMATGPAQAQTSTLDGNWLMRVSCSAHLQNQRSGFDWSANVAVQAGRFSHRRTVSNPDPALASEEIWTGRFEESNGKARVTLGATGSRQSGAAWEIRFEPNFASRELADLTGAVHNRDGTNDVKVRNCTAQLSREATKGVAAVQSVTSALNAAINAATPKTTNAPAELAKAIAQPAPAQVNTASAAGPRSLPELRKALYSDPGLDLAMVAILPGQGNLKRTLDGKWTVGKGRVGVDVQLTTRDLRNFAHLHPKEREAMPGGLGSSFYISSLYYPEPVPGTETKQSGFSGPTPTVRAGIPAGPAVRPASEPEMKPEQALQAAIFHAVTRSMRAIAGPDFRFASSSSSSHSDMALVPRHLVDPAYKPARVEGQWILRLERAEAEILGYITQEQLREGLKTQNNLVKDENQRDSNLMASLKNSPTSGPDSLLGAITVRTGVNVKPCALNSEIDLAIFLLKHEPLGKWITDGAPKWSHEPPKGFDTAEALFEELKTAHRCSAVFGRGPMIAQLSAALTRDQLGSIVYPMPQKQSEMLALKARTLGFEDTASLQFAESIGSRDPNQIKRLKEFRVTSQATLSQARERLKRYNPKATENIDVLLGLLQDEADASKQGTTIEKLQTARAEREAQESRRAAAAQKEQDQRTAKDFPFVMTVRCRVGNNHIGIEPCLSSGGLNTELELRNGEDYRMFKVYDVQSLGERNDAGLQINLRSKFSLKIQNASSTAVLDVVVRERASGAIKFQKSAAQFGVVAVQN